MTQAAPRAQPSRTVHVAAAPAVFGTLDRLALAPADVVGRSLHELPPGPFLTLRDTMRRAALRHAQAHNSDPFAYARALKDIRRGFADASAVLAEANSALRSRDRFGVMIPVAS